jgi:aminoglycoside phosphotransferase (APT) family kinase protein
MTDAQETIARLLAAHGRPAQSVRPLGSGLDHAAFEVDGDLVVRLSSQADPAARGREVRREAELLRRVAALSPLPVPVPLLVDPDGGWLAYRKLPGEPLLGVPDPAAHATTVGAALGALLAVLHAQPPEDWAGLADDDDTPPAAWLGEAREAYAELTGTVPAERRAAVEDFLHAPPPPAAPHRVLSHNDLGVEHVLVDPATGRVTGIIDWTDTAVVDPARDLGLILRDLGDAGLEAALAAQHADGHGDGTMAEHLRARARFYARCSLLEDLAYGVGTGQDPYVRKSLTALPRLFPDPRRTEL